ncbi:Long-chain-fatty-acid--CoA ligase [Bacillus sp. THAF10]|uniref:AMP-binding protein n=1 Tax=Bacillus sp. THAF10 TaxID=2587848 RepID=UPI001268FF6F|nr:AMP-binding protein [Bacillus sp. THAF10]QFT89166.1 Long-chain-fatty-acid--CoA ligase [Bacillus sp. THAF10]
MATLIHKTIGQLLDETTDRYPDKDAVVYVENNLRYSYRAFQEICNQVAKGLMSLGIKKGDHIAVWAANKPEWVITQFASAKIGAVLVTVNTSYQTKELEYLLRQSDSTTLLLMDEFKGVSYLDMIYSLCPELKEMAQGQMHSEKLPMLKNIIYMGSEQHPGMYNWDFLLTNGTGISDEELIQRQKQTSPDEVINMQYTSGTTGFPKGVMLTHSNIINNALNVAECQNITSEDKICIPVPFFHCFGCVMGTLAAVATGATMVPITVFDPLLVLKAVEQEQCTSLYGVPTMFIAELNHPDFSNYDLSSLRTGIMAGSPCPTEIMKKVVNDMGAKEITIAYGQTEASPVITQTRPNDSIERRVSTVGRALDNVEVKVIDPVTGDTVPHGVQGELCTRGYLVMKGYYKMPDQTNDTLDAEGWLHTGDLATMDVKGYVVITGRLKDMIIRGGENIYPREIEEFLYTHPKVFDVQVVGVPDERFGEQVAAFIKVKPGETLSGEEIKAYCNGNISKFKIPYYIEIVEEYPMTASGKIQKFKLREHAVKTLVTP